MSSHDSFVASGTSPTRKKPSAVTTVEVDHSQSFLTIKEVASLLRCSVSCVRAWRFAGKIPFVQANGKNLLFKRADVDAFVERHTTPAKTGRAA